MFIKEKGSKLWNRKKFNENQSKVRSNLTTARKIKVTDYISVK